jgi:tRNA(fMet)-specific endonuclease VapC
VSLLLLDTTLLVDVDRDTTSLQSWLEDDDDVAVAAITVAELFVGVELASPRHRRSRSGFIDQLIETVPVLAYDLAVVKAHAHLLAAVRKAGRHRGAHDLIIAATAVAHGRTVVTADPRGFVDLPDVKLRTHR